jgi:hypothetical protein
MSSHHYYEGGEDIGTGVCVWGVCGGGGRGEGHAQCPKHDYGGLDLPSCPCRRAWWCEGDVHKLEYDKTEHTPTLD